MLSKKKVNKHYYVSHQNHVAKVARHFCSKCSAMDFQKKLPTWTNAKSGVGMASKLRRTNNNKTELEQYER